MGLVYNPRGAARSNDCQTRSGWGVANGIKADPHDFTCAYGSVEKVTMAYGSGTWVHTHDAWILWEGRGIIRMLLTVCMLPVCQYWTYRRGQGGCSWLGADRRGRRSSKGGGL
jgi:hypothetical protein